MTNEIAGEKTGKSITAKSMNIVVGVPKRYVESYCANADCRKLIEDTHFHECKVTVDNGDVLARRFCDECYNKYNLSNSKPEETTKQYRGRIIVKDIDRYIGITAKNEEEAKKILRQKLHEAISDRLTVFKVTLKE